MAPAAQAPVQNDAKNTPQIRPASDGPDKIASDAAPADARSAPIPGTYYKVVRGDMLTDIAVRAYRDASKFLVIQRANPSLRASADRILVDQVIFIPRAP
jgi:nucleoid-associated protein YgaU